MAALDDDDDGVALLEEVSGEKLPGARAAAWDRCPFPCVGCICCVEGRGEESGKRDRERERYPVWDQITS